MDFIYFKKNYLKIAFYFGLTVLLGSATILLSLDELECSLIFVFQSFIQKNSGIVIFQVVTYIGDFYIWLLFTIGFLLYSYFLSRKTFYVAVELAVNLLLITVATFFLKTIFARPRPHCPNITIYAHESFSAYPSGHVSRATSALLTFLKENRFRKIIVSAGILTLSLSRIILGVHFPTDTIGAIFLSIAVFIVSKDITKSFLLNTNLDQNKI